MNSLREITSTRFLLDGNEFLKFGANDVLEVERPLPSILVNDPDYTALDTRPVYFFRANGRTVAVARKYHCYPSDRHEGEIVIELNSDDLIRDHTEPSHPLSIRRVSDVEPLFTDAAGRSVCTRTWEPDADPRLSNGDVVDVGGTICRVVDKATRVKDGVCLVTYQFTPR